MGESWSKKHIIQVERSVIICGIVNIALKKLQAEKD